MSISKSKKRLVAQKCNWHCAYCGCSLSEQTLMIDHVIPKTSGGTNEISNLLPACRYCNSSKGVKTLEQFRLYLSFKKVVSFPDFNQNQIEFLNKSWTFSQLNIVNDHQFFFEYRGEQNEQ